MRKARLAAATLAVTGLLAPSLARAEDEAPPVDVPTPPPAPAPTYKHFGDVSVTLVERFGVLNVPHAEVGSSGSVRGAGIEARFSMQPDWGAYYRYVSSATANHDSYDWFHGEFMAGVSRRVLAVGGQRLWAPRASAHVDFGVGYATLGTNESCTRSYAPFGTSCASGPLHPTNATGDAIAAELRLSGDVAYGLVYVGVDVGIGAYARIATGSNSVSPPWLSWMPSGQLRLGLGFPF